MADTVHLHIELGANCPLVDESSLLMLLDAERGATESRCMNLAPAKCPGNAHSTRRCREPARVIVDRLYKLTLLRYLTLRTTPASAGEPHAIKAARA